MAFEYRHQPLRAVYYVYYSISILFVRLPYWCLISLAPAWRPRRSWTLSRAVIIRALAAFTNMMFKTGLRPNCANVKKDARSANRLGFLWVDGVPQDMLKEEIANLAIVNGVSPSPIPGYWHGARGPNSEYGQRATVGEKVLYMLHGGGYTAGCGSPDGFVGPLIRDIISNSSGLISRGFAINYRHASSAPFPNENPYPAALIDALSGYQYLVEKVGFRPQDIVVAGESAGGHLALNLARYLVASALSLLSPPGAVILLSPTVDWGGTHDFGDSCSMKRNYRSDYVYPILKSGYTARSLLGSLPAVEICTNSWLSPASLKLADATGLFRDFPPTIIIAGGAEQTVDPMRTLRDRLLNDNGTDKMEYLEYEDAAHNFVGQNWQEPERTQALKELQKWIMAVMG
ncbi:hypothetical protein AcV5_003432 [Taiwanofungus camphoratus]|nr:hypothetical protein AcV5_003432 [Antrodia cinnamomea]